MKLKRFKIAQRYQDALRKHLKHDRATISESARSVGNEALAAGLQTSDLALLHEEVLMDEFLSGCPPGRRAALIRRVGAFFAQAITPSGKEQRDTRHINAQRKFVEALSGRALTLAGINRELSREVTERKAAEEALRKSERHYARLLEQSEQLQEHLRSLSRQVLLTQEDERKKISRELHDVIAQTLTGINIRLVTLKKEAALNPRSLDRNIAHTQRLVEHSVEIVHRFARKLRPAVLDDLGLIPALHSFMENFTTRTGVRARLTAFAGVERLDTGSRTVLFRVAQEALTNVGRHAQASQVEVSIEKASDRICMRIKDDGRSFAVGRVLNAAGGKHLGLLGMRERIEMIGGNFSVESDPHIGTTIVAQIPFRKSRESHRRSQPKSTQR